MAKYDFTDNNGILEITIQSEGGLYNPQSMSLAVPSATLTNEIIKIYDSGKYMDSYFFSNIGLIAGVQPVDINAAFEAITDLIASIIAGGGGGGNTVTTDTIQTITAKKDFSVAAGPAATFTAATGNAVQVTATAGSGVYATSVDGPGVEAFSVNNPGVLGYSQDATGVYAHSQNAIALIVDCQNPANNSDLANYNKNGITQVRITANGKIILRASDTLTASLSIPVGVAPTAPIDGEIWLENNTVTGLKIRLGGVTRTINIT